MIAAINRSQRVVWGVGPTPTAALADARAQLAEKSERLRQIGLGRIEYAQLRPGSIPDTLDGAALYADWAILDCAPGTPLQFDLAIDSLCPRS